MRADRVEELKKFVAAEEAYDFQLTLDNIIKYAAREHPSNEIVYRDIVRKTYAEAWKRIQKLANSLKSLGIEPNCLTKIGVSKQLE